MTDQPTQPRVLIVDDDKFLLDMYCLKFSQAGFAVQSSFSVSEALDALRGGYDPAIVLFDVTMPGEDGFVLLEKIKTEKLAPNARLIALTNQGSDADRKHAEELGVHRYVIKASMIPSEVVQMVKEELGKK
jgi:CheY-like chemotaxis protein